jgi:Glycosyl transferase family 2
VTRRRIPDEVLAAAHARARARDARDWPEADRLRAEIEAAGWKIVDRGIDFALTPASPPDLSDGGQTRYGSSSSVPSRLEEPAVDGATMILIATDWPDDIRRTMDAVRAYPADGCSVVIVADGPSEEQQVALVALEEAEPDPTLPIEVVWTSERLGHATATNIGIRRSTGSVVVLIDPSVEPVGDVVTPLVETLADPSVAVAGGWGIVSADLRTFAEATPGDVDAVEGYLQAFRRSDFVERGPLDERFRFYRNLDIWWSLVLRDQGEGVPPRRAVMLAGLPAVRHEHHGYTSLPPAERDRLSKRNFYRILDRFGSRRDLLVSR